MHVGVDALGNPVRFVLSEGQTADVTGSKWLIEGLDFDFLIADKGYDADWLRTLVTTQHDAQTVIPPRKNRKDKPNYDKELYKVRNMVERFIGWAKHFRRAATRHEKTARNFLSFWQFTAVINLLK